MLVSRGRGEIEYLDEVAGMLLKGVQPNPAKSRRKVR
jgi:hypothetical protein